MLHCSRYGRKSRKDTYNYLNTLQMLGLDEGEDSSNQEPSVIQVNEENFQLVEYMLNDDFARPQSNPMAFEPAVV